MTQRLTFQTKVHFRRGCNGRKHLQPGKAAEVCAAFAGAPPRDRMCAAGPAGGRLLRRKLA